MLGYTTRLITTLAQLRNYAEKWDALWLRSLVTQPTMRAEAIALHIAHFEPGARMWCAIVEADDGQPVAALPLIESRRKYLTVGVFPNNPWSASGDLLLDEAADPKAACEKLVTCLSRVPWPLLWLEGIEYESSRWRTFLKVLSQRGAAWQTNPAFEVGRVDTTGEWEAYNASWGKNHRRNMSRYPKRLQQKGELRAEYLTELGPSEVEPHLQDVFEVEDCSWKGDHASSVLRTANMFQFYLAQAQQFAGWGELNLHYLRLDGKAIATEYGFTAKGVYHPCKIGYDEAYRHEGPGNVMHMHVLRRCFEDPSITAVDFIGPVTRACANWQTSRYTVGRVMIATDLVGKTLLRAYRHVWPAVKRLGRKQADLVDAP